MAASTDGEKLLLLVYALFCFVVCHLLLEFITRNAFAIRLSVSPFNPCP